MSLNQPSWDIKQNKQAKANGGGEISLQSRLPYIVSNVHFTPKTMKYQEFEWYIGEKKMIVPL